MGEYRSRYSRNSNSGWIKIKVLPETLTVGGYRSRYSQKQQQWADIDPGTPRDSNSGRIWCKVLKRRRGERRRGEGRRGSGECKEGMGRRMKEGGEGRKVENEGRMEKD